MTNRPTALLISAALIAVTGIAFAGGDEALRGAVDRFVALDCTTGEATPTAGELRTHGDSAIPLLRQLLDSGPDPLAIENVRLQIEARWEARQAFLESSLATGLSIESQQNVRLRKHDAYVSARLDAYIDHVRERAALGLFAIGSSAARRALAESAAAQAGDLGDLIERLMQSPNSRTDRATRSAPTR